MSAPLSVSSVGDEALDHPGTDPALVERMLCEIAVANRLFGGRSAVAHGLRHLFTGAERNHSYTMLDIGTGAGDLPLWAARWCTRRNIRLHPLGVERLRPAARLAQHNGVTTMIADGGALPCRDGSVDVVMMSQLAHHFDDASIVRLFREAARVARRGVIVSELHPSTFSSLAYRIAGPVLGFHTTTITDGVTSLARGFTRARMQQLVQHSGVENARIERSPFARITASWRVNS